MNASRRRAYWLHIQSYFREHNARRPRKAAKSVRVGVPRRQAMSRRAVATMRELKRKADLRIAAEDKT
jgi:hypothetical protein